jgi:hypothetical protein
VTVFDVSFNALVDPLQQVARMRKVEQLDVAHNHLSGVVPEAICVPPQLKNLTVSNNYFTSEPPSCHLLSRSMATGGTACPTALRSARRSSARGSTRFRPLTAPRSSASLPPCWMETQQSSL